MKKILLLSTLIFLMFTGCKKTTVQPKQSENTIVGKWAITQTVKTDYTVSPKHTAITFVTNRDDNYIFNLDGTGKFSSGSSSITLKYELNMPEIKITYDPPSNQVLNYGVSELSDNRLIILESVQKDNTGKITSTNETYYSRIK